LFPVHPDDAQGLKDLLSRVRSGEIQGLNVTIPQSKTSFRIGRIILNCRNHRRSQHNFLKTTGWTNTDAPGFLKNLNRSPISNRRSEIENRQSQIVNVMNRKSKS
jgi:shikimate 5-dehydrogenase